MNNDDGATKQKLSVGYPDNSFLAVARAAGNSLVVTIPVTLKEFEGLEQGDLLKVWFKKVHSNEGEEQDAGDN